MRGRPAQETSMPTRRQEKISRVVRDVVSDAIANHLSDPRIEGLVSVTRVTVAADLRVADVYLSIFGGEPAAQNRTFEAITHARPRIQALLGEELRSRFCPVLRLHLDEGFKKTLETMRLINQVAEEIRSKETAGPDRGEERV